MEGASVAGIREAVEAIERKRLAALFSADMQTAERIHAHDFQLITALGAVFSRDEYLGAVATGVIKYVVVELESPIDARLTVLHNRCSGGGAGSACAGSRRRPGAVHHRVLQLRAGFRDESALHVASPAATSG